MPQSRGEHRALGATGVDTPEESHISSRYSPPWWGRDCTRKDAQERARKHLEGTSQERGAGQEGARRKPA